MRNLLANALDAIPAEGTITVVVENHDGNVVMTVSDTGRGIGKGELDLIFEPFYTTKEGKRGMGMGLFIVRQLCLKMSWNISVESMEGTGTVFTISQKRTLA
jgi:signal transduction histidine kinase